MDKTAKVMTRQQSRQVSNSKTWAENYPSPPSTVLTDQKSGTYTSVVHKERVSYAYVPIRTTEWFGMDRASLGNPIG